MRASVAAAEQADDLHAAAARRLIEERIAATDDLYLDLDGPGDIVVDLPAASGGVVGGVLGATADPAPRTIELRYQRGLRDYPADLVDAQAQAVRHALEQCLSADDDLADELDRIGTVSLTVRIDHGRSPPRLHVVGGHGLAPCLQAQITVLPADGVFVAVLRVSG